MSQKYSNKIKLECISLVKEGKSYVEVGKLFKIPPSTVRGWAKDAGFDSGVKSNTKYSDEIKSECIALVKGGKSYVEVGKLLGPSPTVIGLWARNAGFDSGVKSNTKYSDEIKSECIALMKEGKTNSEINKLLGPSTRTLQQWKRKAGLIGEYSGSSKKRITNDQINDIIDLIREGYPLGEIIKITGVGGQTIKKIHTKELRDGNPLPELKKGIAKNQKYSDESLIDLAFLNQGFGFKKFIEHLAISFNLAYNLFVEFKAFTNEEEDLLLLLATNDVPQKFNWGNINRINSDQKVIDWIINRINSKGKITSQSDADDFSRETGVSISKFNDWLTRAELVYDRGTMTWINPPKGYYFNPHNAQKNTIMNDRILANNLALKAGKITREQHQANEKFYLEQLEKLKFDP